jgi:hypothetical protein
MKKIAASLLNFSVDHIVALWLIPAAVLCWSVEVFLKYGRTAEGTRRSIRAFIFSLMGAGVDSGCLGLFVGMLYFCALLESGLRGLGGFFFGAPVFSALGVSVFLYLWARHEKTS